MLPPNPIQRQPVFHSYYERRWPFIPRLRAKRECTAGIQKDGNRFSLQLRGVIRGEHLSTDNRRAIRPQHLTGDSDLTGLRDAGEHE